MTKERFSTKMCYLTTIQEQGERNAKQFTIVLYTLAIPG